MLEDVQRSIVQKVDLGQELMYSELLGQAKGAQAVQPGAQEGDIPNNIHLEDLPGFGIWIPFHFHQQ